MEKKEIRRIKLIEINGSNKYATLNLAPGNSVYGEKFVILADKEYRLWDPIRSKLAAALVNGLKCLPIKEDSRILYLGASTGTTVSHISDIIGEHGIVFAVEVAPRVAREFFERVVLKRSNVIPILSDARRPEKYLSIFSKVDVVYSDITQADQTDIALNNCKKYLKKGGSLILIIKSRSIDTTADPNEIFKSEINKIEQAELNIKQIINLEPFDIDHVLISAIL